MAYSVAHEAAAHGAAVHPRIRLAEASRAYAVEAVGTFFLVFTVLACVLGGVSSTALAAGATLMVMIYAGAHISGGYFNPAVTLAVLLRGRIGLRTAAGYWIAELSAGVVAAFLARWAVEPSHASTLRLSGHDLAAAAVAELLFTFALCFVVLNVATSRDQRDNGFYGLAIGFTIAAGGLAVGGISGGAFNPAVTLGGAIGGAFAWSTLWVYFVAQLVAGAAAAAAFLTLNPADS